MKASWNGYFRLGDLTVPIRLFSATRSAGPKFVQIDSIEHKPITRVAKSKSGKELKSDEIHRAIELDDRYIEITDDEIIESSGGAERNIIVRQFGELESINPMYYEKPYYMVPGKGGELAYSLLRQAFVRAKKIAVTTFALYGKQHIGIITAHDGMLLLQQLRFADEIVPRADIKTPPLSQPAPSQVDIAIKLMERYSAPFYVEDYHNEQLDNLNEIIERKVKGLPAKRQSQVAPHATPEKEVTPALEAMFSNAPDTLRQR